MLRVTYLLPVSGDREITTVTNTFSHSRYVQHIHVKSFFCPSVADRVRRGRRPGEPDICVYVLSN